MKRAVVIARRRVAALAVGFGLGQLWLPGTGSGERVAEGARLRHDAPRALLLTRFRRSRDCQRPTFWSTRGRSRSSSVACSRTSGPYEPLDPPRVGRASSSAISSGAFATRYEHRLPQERGCDTASAGVSDFPAGALRYRFKDRDGNAFESFDWPLLEVASRVRRQRCRGIRWRSDASRSSLRPIASAPIRGAVLSSLRSAARLQRSCSRGGSGGPGGLTRPDLVDDVTTREARSSEPLDVALGAPQMR